MSIVLRTKGLPACVLIAMISACSLAPEYHVPAVTTPVSYKESQGWIEAQPQDELTRGSWWKVFKDPQLDDLEEQATAGNQSLKGVLAQYDQARDAVKVARAAYFPNLTATPSATREMNSHTLANNASVNLYNNYVLGGDLSYEIDLWGRVRNTVESNQDQAEANAADLASLDLSIHAEVANDYFMLRGDDEMQKILDQAAKADQEALDLTERRYKGGVAPEVDVDQAEAQLENARTAATDMRLVRAQLEHALAILTGKAPADFTLAPATLVAKIPHNNIGLPSTLLQRRPDIAAAERRVAAANAQIGVARAAWFPTFNLMAMAGFQSAATTTLLKAPSEFWSLGPSVVMPIFEGGQNNALISKAHAAYDEEVAAYRQTVLTAYGEVEDNLTELHRLSEESKTQSAALVAAERSLMQARNRYKEGVTTYLDVAIAENDELKARLAFLAITLRRLTASVGLIKALGGAWKMGSEIP